MRPHLTTCVAAIILAAGCEGSVQVGSNLKIPAIEGSGTAKTETREVGPFSALEVHAAIHATVTPGDKVSVSLEGDDNLLPLVETTVRDGRLVAKFKDNTNVRTKKELK